MEEFAIKFQDGLLKDGRNGLTVEEAIAEVAKRIWLYNSKVPCKGETYTAEKDEVLTPYPDTRDCLGGMWVSIDRTI